MIEREGDRANGDVRFAPPNALAGELCRTHLVPTLRMDMEIVRLLEDILSDLIGISRLARNPAAKKLLALRMQQIRDALAAAAI